MPATVIDSAIFQEQGARWTPSFLHALKVVGGEYATWLLLLSGLAGYVIWRQRYTNS